jgi:hypothetical protein
MLSFQPAAPVEVRLVVQPDATFLQPPADAVLPPRKSWRQLGRYTADAFYGRFLACLPHFG